MRLKADVEALSLRRIPGLDGVRAISIALVLLSHVLIHSVGLSGRPMVVQYAYGEDGVVFFFALSGFLITTLLLREKERTDRISLAAFYARRTLRIWPVWFIYLAAVAVLEAVGVGHVNARAWIGAATFTLNFVPRADGVALAHGWSLAIEEQFYLLWPLLLLALLRSRRPALVVAVAVATAPIWRWLAWHLMPFVQQFGRQSTFNRAGALLAGCLVALLLADPLWRSRFERVVSRQSVGAAVAILLAAPFLDIAAGRHAEQFDLILGLSLADLPLAFLVGAVVVRPSSGAVRALTRWPIVLLGLMSYSLYVWQQVFLFHPRLPVALGVAGALAAGFMSWRLVELRSGLLKDRMFSRSNALSSSQPLGYPPGPAPG